MRRHAIAPLLILLLAGCRIVDERDRARDAPTTPTAPTAPVPDTIEFRVLGNLTAVTIRQSNSLDGLTQTITGLPYRVTITSTRDTLFVSLDATGVADASNNFVGFLQAQILANGVVFREASAIGFQPAVSISGTFRR